MSAIKNSNIHKTSKVESGSHVIDSSFGRHSFCGYDCEIIHCDVGGFCSIANGVIIGGGAHPMEWVGMSPVFYAGRDSVAKKFSIHPRAPVAKTTIGNDVWIGANALIKQGITVGDGAVIGMGSIVTKDVEPYSIVGGSPARLIRMRFAPNIVKALLEIRWWEFDDQKLEKYASYITNPELFIREISNS